MRTKKHGAYVAKLSRRSIAVDTRQLALALVEELRQQGAIAPPAVVATAVAPQAPAPSVYVSFGTAAERWEAIYLKKISPSSVSDVRSTVRRLVELFGSMTPMELTSHTAEMCLLELTDTRTRKTLSVRSRIKYRMVGVHIVNKAISDGVWIGKNPFEGVTAWRRQKKRRRAVLTPAEARRLLDNAGRKKQRTFFSALFAVALYTTMRKSEILNWRREDIDLERCVFNVVRSGGNDHTKNGDIREELPLHRELVPYLRAQLASHDSAWVFPQKDGSKHSEKWKLSAVTRRTLARAGIVDATGAIKDITFHGLRRCGSTLYKTAGTDRLVRKLLMGHAVRDITDEVYTELDDGFMRREIHRMTLEPSGGNGGVSDGGGTVSPASEGASVNQTKGIDAGTPFVVMGLRASNPEALGSIPSRRVSLFSGTCSCPTGIDACHHRSLDEELVWQQILARVEVDSAGCWIWQGKPNDDGYGKIRVGGRTGTKEYVHRVAYVLQHGAISEDLVVRHGCDKRTCVRGRCLRAGTHGDNQQDKVERLRQAKGEGNGRAKLNAAKVEEILRRLGAGESQTSIALAYGVDQKTISAIASGKTWRHIPRRHGEPVRSASARNARAHGADGRFTPEVEA